MKRLRLRPTWERNLARRKARLDTQRYVRRPIGVGTREGLRVLYSDLAMLAVSEGNKRAAAMYLELMQHACYGGAQDRVLT